MTTTSKRISFCLTKENLRQLEEIKVLFGEGYSDIIKRALNSLYERNKGK